MGKMLPFESYASKCSSQSHGCWALQGKPLSDAKRHECEWKLLPPRKVHPDVLQSLKQVSLYATAP